MVLAHFLSHNCWSISNDVKYFEQLEFDMAKIIRNCRTKKNSRIINIKNIKLKIFLTYYCLCFSDVQRLVEDCHGDHLREYILVYVYALLDEQAHFLRNTCRYRKLPQVHFLLIDSRCW